MHFYPAVSLCLNNKSTYEIVHFTTNDLHSTVGGISIRFHSLKPPRQKETDVNMNIILYRNGSETENNIETELVLWLNVFLLFLSLHATFDELREFCSFVVNNKSLNNCMRFALCVVADQSKGVAVLWDVVLYQMFLSQKRGKTIDTSSCMICVYQFC